MPVFKRKPAPKVFLRAKTEEYLEMEKKKWKRIVDDTRKIVEAIGA